MVHQTPNTPPTTNEPELERALAYAAAGLHVIPLRWGKKNPEGAEWQHRFTTDPEQVRMEWHRKWNREQGWVEIGTYAPHGVGHNPGLAGLVVLDIDNKKGKSGFAFVQSLKDQLDKQMPKTLFVETPSGGRHYYYQGNYETNKKFAAKGLEVFGSTGQVVLPDTTIGRTFYKWGKLGSIVDNPERVAPFPLWLAEHLKLVETQPITTETQVPDSGFPGPVPPIPADDLPPVDGSVDFERTGEIPPATPAESGVLEIIVTDEMSDKKIEEVKWANAVWWLYQLEPQRAHDYDQWLHVGFALHEFGDKGLSAWDHWSKQDDKYESGDHRDSCAAKWTGMQDDLPEGEAITYRSLKRWVIDDRGEDFKLPPAPAKGKKPSDYQRAMEAAGWEFRMNEADYDITFMGISLSGPLQSVLNTRLREYGYTQMAVAHDLMEAMAFRNSYHPIKDYLESLSWDGEDHISKLAAYFTDEHNVFDKWLRYWLIGAVARLYENNARGTQNRILVLDGRQNIGKSYFVRWLTWEIPEAGYEGPINPEDKDNDIRLMRSWVWEVSELGSTVRKADREALKAFVSKQMVDVRKPYDPRPVRRPAISNFIGTINNESGFLEDPTGHRRFMVATLTDVNWDYATEMKAGQIWAQAHALYQGGESWTLAEEDRLLSENICGKYERTDVLEEYILQYFEIDESCGDWFTSNIEILEKLKTNGKIGRETDRGSQMRIAQILTKYGLKQARQYVGPAQQRGYLGITERGRTDREVFFENVGK